MSDSMEYRNKIRRGEPIECKGLTFYPVSVERYEEYKVYSKVLLLRQRTLPVAYMVLPYLSALYKMDADNGFKTGMVEMLLRVLSMATLLKRGNFDILPSKDDTSKLHCIVCRKEDSSLAMIKPEDFPEIRKVITDQNGDKLPDEADNPELIEAEEDLAQKITPVLDVSFDNMLAGVAVNLKMRFKDVLSMTILEFDQCFHAIDRDKRYMLCAQAEYSGMIKFKDGNPCPAWYADRKNDGSGALIPLGTMAKNLGIGQKDIQQG